MVAKTIMSNEHYRNRLIEKDNLQKVFAINRQLRLFKRSEKADCMCGKMLHSYQMFRCLYCGEWYCQPCAEKHFGKTRKEYDMEHS